MQGIFALETCFRVDFFSIDIFIGTYKSSQNKHGGS